jgi:hypothetical protein
VGDRHPVTTAVDIKGAWQTETYVANGTTHSVDGVLLLTADRWSTLYFVPFPDGVWGSAEAGAYAYDGTRLTFHHRLIFQGGGRRPLEINQSASRVEVCHARLEGDRFTISFPSGNLLHLRRVGA